MKTNLGLFLDFIKSREFVSSANVFKAIVAKNKIITVQKKHTMFRFFRVQWNLSVMRGTSAWCRKCCGRIEANLRRAFKLNLARCIISGRIRSLSHITRAK